MNILSQDGKTLINYNNIVSINIEPLERAWHIKATYNGGSCIILATFYDKDECKNTFDKLCDKIKISRENDTIDLEDLWGD